MANMVLNFSKFEVSYLGVAHALSYIGKRANLRIAALLFVAVLTAEMRAVSRWNSGPARCHS
jgi:hypothetical protein